jgi:hypothetical protein
MVGFLVVCNIVRWFISVLMLLYDVNENNKINLHKNCIGVGFLRTTTS